MPSQDTRNPVPCRPGPPHLHLPRQPAAASRHDPAAFRPSRSRSRPVPHHLPRSGHSYATGALRARMSPKVISERIGHANVGFFMETYVCAGKRRPRGRRTGRRVPDRRCVGVRRRQPSLTLPWSSEMLRITHQVMPPCLRVGVKPSWSRRRCRCWPCCCRCTLEPWALAYS